MKIAQLNVIKSAAIICIFTCILDLALLYLFGSFYPGYSQMKDTMSSLGAAVSPVSNEISIWWIGVGLVFIYFGIIFKKAFNTERTSVKIASVLIMLYGFGEGIGSGAFKANRISGEMTKSLLIHDALGGIGMVSILIFPLVMQRVFLKKEKPIFYLFSWMIFSVGVIMTALFSVRFSSNETNFIAIYKGLWQRIFLINTYLYFITISIIMYTNKKNITLKK